MRLGTVIIRGWQWYPLPNGREGSGGREEKTEKDEERKGRRGIERDEKNLLRLCTAFSPWVDITGGYCAALPCHGDLN